MYGLLQMGCLGANRFSRAGRRPSTPKAEPLFAAVRDHKKYNELGQLTGGQAAHR